MQYRFLFQPAKWIDENVGKTLILSRRKFRAQQSVLLIFISICLFVSLVSFADEPVAVVGASQEMVQSCMTGMNGPISIRGLQNNGADQFIYMISFFDPSKKKGDEGSFQPWRLIKRDDQSGKYELFASGDYVEGLMSLHDAPGGKKYGMPASGYPQGTAKGASVLDTDTVRLSANKELGDCGTVFDLHGTPDKASYVLLVAKDSGQWIIVEVAPNDVSAKYLARGNQSLFLGVPRKLAFGVKQDAPHPLLTDDVSHFDGYYGDDGLDRSNPASAPRSRCWWRDDYVIVYDDQKPKYVSIAFQKVTGAGFDQSEVFDLAKSFCGEASWKPVTQRDDFSSFGTEDKKYGITWSHKKAAQGGTHEPQVVTVLLDSSQADIPSTIPKPMLNDDPQAFENYYGKVQANDLGWTKVRIWKRGNFIIMHMDCRPERLMIDVHKADQTEITQQEVFDIGARFCGVSKWNSKGQNEKSTVFASDDNKFSINWYKNDLINAKDPSTRYDHVTLTYSLPDKSPDKSIDKL